MPAEPCVRKVGSMLQVPAIIKSQAALVVSPTISLMKDQVAALCQQGLAACLLGASAAPKNTACHQQH